MKTTTEVPTVDGFYWRKHELDDWYLVELRNGGRHCYYVGYDIALPIGGEASKGGVWSERLDNPHEEEVKDKKTFEQFMDDIWECPHEIGDGRPGLEPHPHEPHVYDVWEDDGKWLGDGGDEALYEPYQELDDDHDARDDYPDADIDADDWDYDPEPVTVETCQPTVVDSEDSFTVYVPGPYGWNRPKLLTQEDLTKLFQDFWRGCVFARTSPLFGDIVAINTNADGTGGDKFIMGTGSGCNKWYRYIETE